MFEFIVSTLVICKPVERNVRILKDKNDWSKKWTQI